MKRAFTLIELLIVIAIIAILALIAIPNFLDAQVRSKVARVEADMRSVANAVETYITDYGRPFVDADEWKDIHGTTSAPADRLLQRPLTTPIAYLAHLPIDPFVERGHLITPDYTPTYERDKPYRIRSFLTLQVKTDGTASKERENVRNNGFMWMMRSLGPGRTAVNPLNPDAYVNESQTLLGGNTFVYDPTNGTISLGLIIRTNKGGFAVGQR